MKRLHLALRFTEFGSGREALADRLSVPLAGQPVVGTVAGLAGLMTTAVHLSATALNGGDGPTAKITQRLDLCQDAGALLFESGERIRQEAPPIRTYTYVRIITPMKESSQDAPFMSHTPYSYSFGLKSLIFDIVTVV